MFDQDQDQGRLPNGRHFAFGDLLLKSTKSKQKCLLLVWPFLRQGSFTPVPLRGPAAIRHPWRGAALAASMRLGPRSETCVQPAPKSRFVSSGSYVFEDQDQDPKQSNSFPAEAGPTRDTAGPTGCPRCFLVGPALAGKRPVWALAVLQTRLPPCGSELAREGIGTSAE